MSDQKNIQMDDALPVNAISTEITKEEVKKPKKRGRPPKTKNTENSKYDPYNPQPDGLVPYKVKEIEALLNATKNNYEEEKITFTKEQLDTYIEKKVKERLTKNKNEIPSYLIDKFLNITLITDTDFIEKLIKWNVKPEWCNQMTNIHKNFSVQKIFEFIRNNNKTKPTFTLNLSKNR